MSARLRIAIVDSEPMFKHGIRLAIAGGRSRVIGMNYTRRQLVDLIRREQPDVLVINEDCDGFVLNSIGNGGTHRPSIIAFVDDDISPLQIGILRRLGVLGFLHRTATPHELRTALRHVSNGRPFRSARIEPLTSEVPWLETSDFDVFDLRILNALALGASRKSTAATVGLKVSSVKYRLKKVYRSLDVENWRQAVHRLAAITGPGAHNEVLAQRKRHDRPLSSVPDPTPGVTAKTTRSSKADNSP